MKLSSKISTLILAILLNNVFVFSQGSYDWNEHNEAVHNINSSDSITGWWMFFVTIGIFYLLYNFISNIKKKNINLNNSVENLPKIDFYVGEKKEGKKHGTGKMIYANGDTYEGSWKNDKYHGFGVFKSKNKEEKGNWFNGAPFGEFEYLTDSKTTFKGEIHKSNGAYEVLELWNSYKKEIDKCRTYITGKGIWIYSDRILEGEFRNVERYGVFGRRFFGKVTYKIGSIYDEESEGDIYEGELEDFSKRDGFGKMKYSNGEIYEGYWCQNKREYLK
jgi:hypothetical protein